MDQSAGMEARSNIWNKVKLFTVMPVLLSGQLCVGVAIAIKLAALLVLTA